MYVSLYNPLLTLPLLQSIVVHVELKSKYLQLISLILTPGMFGTPEEARLSHHTEYKVMFYHQWKLQVFGYKNLE